jgi:hypothetical protein
VPDEQLSEVEAILDRSHGVTASSRGADYRQSGWTGFDEKAPAYTSEEIAREQTRYAL